jgi:hypothetical protein
MTQCCEVAHGLPDPLQVVNPDADGPSKLLAGVGNHERDVFELQSLDQLLLYTKSQNCYAINPPLHHPANDEFCSSGIETDGAQQDFVFLLHGNLLEGLDNFGKEWVGDLLNDETKDPTTAENQGSCLRIWVVMKLIHYVPDASDEARIHSWHTIQGPRHRRG